MQEILIIEDNNDINNLVCEALTKAGYVCTQAFSGTEGLLHLKNGSFSLVFLDLMLPGMNGESVLPKIKKNFDIPVIVMSAKDSIDTKISLLDAGADDYVSKPFGMMEMVSRVKAVLRRTKRENETEIYEVKNLKMNLKKHKVKVEGNEVTLTLKEYELLKHLMQNQNTVLTRNRLLEEVWGYDFAGESRTLDVHVRSLRQKLGTAGDLIETVRGVGYRMGGIYEE